MWESQESEETHVHHRLPWYDLTCWKSAKPQFTQPVCLSHWYEDNYSIGLRNRSLVYCTSSQAGYSPTILKIILNLVLQIFLHLEVFEINTSSDWLNPLLDMPILGSSNSARNKDMVSKILINRDTIFWLSRKHCGKRNCSFRAISASPTMFSKAVGCLCSKGLTN